MHQQPQPKNQPVPNEDRSSSFSPVPVGSPAIAMNDFRKVLDTRLTMLESIKEIVSMRFYDRVADKLKQEEAKAAELSGASQDKQKRQARYSHVLDPQYFEQKFL